MVSKYRTDAITPDAFQATGKPKRRSLVFVILGMAILILALVLLPTDHLTWEGSDAPSELGHLRLLQDKINAYISFLESGQFKESYPGEDFAMAAIQVHFKHPITENCEKFLNAVQDQVGQLGVKIEAVIAE